MRYYQARAIDTPDGRTNATAYTVSFSDSGFFMPLLRKETLLKLVNSRTFVAGQNAIFRMFARLKNIGKVSILCGKSCQSLFTIFVLR